MSGASNTIDYLAGSLYSTLRFDGEKVDKNCIVDLPDIPYTTVEIPAMGTMTVPLVSIFDDAELVYHPTNSTKKAHKTMTPGTHELDYRWNQIEYEEGTAKQKTVLHKVIATVTSKKISTGRTIEKGTKAEAEIPFSVFSYREYVDGEPILEWDRFAETFKYLGVDYGMDYFEGL